MTDAPKNYEIAFHIHPDLEEAVIRAEREKIEQLITSHKAVITYSKEPEKTRLSYEINHIRSSYFGYIQFSLPDAEALVVIDEQLRLDGQIIRYIILKTETEDQKRKAATRAAVAKQDQERRAKKQQAAKQDKPAGVIDQQIEQIIEGL